LDIFITWLFAFTTAGMAYKLW